MKKSLLLASLLAIGATSVAAMDIQWFVGVGAERAKADSSATASGVTVNGSSKDTSAKVGTGVILDKNHRFSLSYSKFDEDGAEFKRTLLSYDYLFTLESKFTPFVGLHYGRISGKIDAGSGLTIDDTGNVYGVQAGTLYAITDNIEFEANIAYSKSNFDSPIKLNGVNVANTKYELDKSTSLYIGFNYKF